MSRLRLALMRLLAMAVLYGPIALFAAQHVPPSFLTQPASVAIPAGQSAAFFVVASGSPTLGYQWRFNGTDIPGATDTNLVVFSANSSNAGLYSVQVTNGYGTTNSADATLIANYPPIILVHPVSQAALLGSNVAFQVSATGTPAFGYRWQFNGVPVPGGTNAAPTISAAQSNNVGAYAAVVTNAGGTTTSLVATLSIATSPDFLWARSVSNGIPPDGPWGLWYGRNVAADASGNVFAVGSFEGWNVLFGGGLLTSPLPYDYVCDNYFLCKYDRWGNFQWATLFGTNALYGGPVTSARVATDSSGNAYLAGWFVGTTTFGTNVLVSSGPSDLFIAKYDSQGQVAWARQIIAEEPYYYYLWLGFAVDAQGNSVLASQYTNAVDFGNVILSNSVAFLAKYDSSGNMLWAKPSLAGDALAVGPSGSIFVTGSSNSAFSSTPAMLAKYDSFGKLLWSRQFPHGEAITVDAAENIYTTGFGNGTYNDITVTNVGGQPDFFVAKCDAAGQSVWVRQAGSVWQQTGMGIGVDGPGNVYVASTSANKYPEPVLVFGGSVLTNTTSFLVKYNSTGDPLWAKALPYAYPIQGGLSLNDLQEICLAGTFSYRASFGVFNLQTSNPYGNEAMYVAKLAAGADTAPPPPPVPPKIIAQPQGVSVTIGANPTFGVMAYGGMPLNYRWVFNGTNTLSTGTNSSFTLTNAEIANAGNYTAVVTNAYGSATSALATLTVYPADGGTLSSPSIFNTNHQVRFNVTGLAGLKYAVQASSNLVNWIYLSTNTSPFLFTDPNAGNFARRYYRSIYIP